MRTRLELTLVCGSMDTETPSTVTLTFPSLKVTQSSPNMSLWTSSLSHLDSFCLQLLLLPVC